MTSFNVNKHYQIKFGQNVLEIDFRGISQLKKFKKNIKFSYSDIRIAFAFKTINLSQ